MESLFDIFGERAIAEVNRPKSKNLSRLQLGNENIGKVFSSGSYAAPIKPNEPLKKADNKKSFLANKGAAIQSTPLKSTTPFGKGFNQANIQPMKIYSDAHEMKITPSPDFEIEIEFHKPSIKDNNYDMFDGMFACEVELPARENQRRSPTPEPLLQLHQPELNYSYQDDFFNDDFFNDSFRIEDIIDLPSY